MLKKLLNCFKFNYNNSEKEILIEHNCAKDEEISRTPMIYIIPFYGVEKIDYLDKNETIVSSIIFNNGCKLYEIQPNELKIDLHIEDKIKKSHPIHNQRIEFTLSNYNFYGMKTDCEVDIKTIELCSKLASDFCMDIIQIYGPVICIINNKVFGVDGNLNLISSTKFSGKAVGDYNGTTFTYENKVSSYPCTLLNDINLDKCAS